MSGEIHLGEVNAYPETYAPELLRPIARAEGRRGLAIAARAGQDLWTAFELSWLGPMGKPQVAVGEIIVPADSPYLIESKSLKYYLNSLNQMRYGTWDEVGEVIARDLSAAAGALVQVRLFTLELFADQRRKMVFMGECLDNVALGEPEFEVSADLLELGDEVVEDKIVCSHLLKTNCPITGQPDWASVWIGYSGRNLRPASLLRYLVSYRTTNDFHEHCVERIYSDIQQAAAPESLWVLARYTRRGGLDINPYRASSAALAMPDLVAPRQ